MKKILAIMFLFFLFTTNVIAETIPVKVIDSSFLVWGDGYYKSGTTPQYGSYYLEFTNIEGYPSSIGSSSSAGLFNVTSDSDVNDQTFMSVPNSYAGVTAKFKPLNNFNTLIYSYNLVGNLYAGFSGSLIDLTDNIEIWNLDMLFAGMEAEWNAVDTIGITYAFRSDHLYGINISVGTGGTPFGYTSANFGFPDLKAVPEPATMLLLGLGLVGLAGVRRKL